MFVFFTEPATTEIYLLPLQDALPISGTVVTLDASTGGAVTETTGAVVADQLLVGAQNSSALTTATNNVTTVAATIAGAGQDRKSTRLNSSHLGKSDAVYGLTNNQADH